ncbi:hypothetical protein NRI58_002123 [Vibrio parahaemolyticus]|nr:hypothetical protein [Vibrio parahaemolyticus]ELB2262281.1 hypothetical protein [Vibrio parahaemolyticus]
MKYKNRIITTLLAGMICSSIANANTDEQPIVQTLDVYQEGLIATVYSEEKKTGTWASPKPTGIPIGEFVDGKIPSFSFINLKQDAAAWSIYSGSHIGIEWNGYFYAEEAGNYVLMLDLVKKENNTHFANSCIADLSLSGSSVVTNSFKWKKIDYHSNKEHFQQTKTNSVNLESGYYPLKLWLHCGVTKGEWNYWVDDADTASWTLKVKRPSDRIVQVAPVGTLVWK